MNVFFFFFLLLKDLNFIYYLQFCVISERRTVAARHARLLQGQAHKVFVLLTYEFDTHLQHSSPGRRKTTVGSKFALI